MMIAPCRRRGMASLRLVSAREACWNVRRCGTEDWGVGRVRACEGGVSWYVCV